MGLRPVGQHWPQERALGTGRMVCVIPLPKPTAFPEVGAVAPEGQLIDELPCPSPPLSFTGGFRITVRERTSRQICPVLSSRPRPQGLKFSLKLNHNPCSVKERPPACEVPWDPAWACTRLSSPHLQGVGGLSKEGFLGTEKAGTCPGSSLQLGTGTWLPRGHG